MRDSLFVKNALINADKYLLALYFTFVGIGLVSVYSVSRYSGVALGLSPYTLFVKQFIFACLSIVMMLFFSQIHYNFTKKIVKPLVLVTFILLLMVFIPHVGVTVGVARRWINLKFMTFNPSELAKLTLTIYLAYIFTKKTDLSNFTSGILPPLILASMMFGIIILQSGFSIGVIIMTVIFSMFFIGGAPLKHLFSIGMMVVPILIIAVSKVSYRVDRIIAYLDPWSDPSGVGYQSIQSLQALANGGIFGRGIGNGVQKISRLPAAHTDFIFSVIVEETGLVGGILLVIMFGIFFWYGLAIACRITEKYAQLLAFGIVILITTHALFNIMIALALLPPTGVSLPFISYGGSSFFILSIAMGILLNISAQFLPVSKN